MMLVHSVFCGFLFLISYVLAGVAALKLLRIPLNGIEKLSISFTFGTFATSCILFFLGQLQLYNAPILGLVSFGPILLLASSKLRSEIQTLAHEVRDELQWRGYFILLIFLAVGIFCLYPVGGWDDTAHQLPTALAYLKHGGMKLLPELRFPTFTHANHLLYVPILQFSDDITAQWPQWGFYCMIVLFVYSRLSRTLNKNWALFGAVVLGLSQLMISMSRWILQDMSVTAHITVFLLFFIQWLESQSRKDFVICLISFGAACSIKYTGLLLIPVACCLVFSQPRLWKQVLPMLVLGFILASPWYLRNWWLSGNPVFPTPNPLFTTFLWSEAEVRAHHESILHWGVQKNIWEFLKLPYTFSYELHRIGNYPTVPRHIALAFPLIVVGFFYRRSRWLALASFTFILEWFLTLQNIRYFMGILPSVVIVQTQVLEAWAQSLREWSEKKNLHPYVLFAVKIYLIFIVLQTGIRYIGERLIFEGPIPTTVQEKKDYWSGKISGYKFVQAANDICKSACRIFGYGLENTVYFAEGSFVGDWMGPYSYDKYDEAEKNQTLDLWLDSNGITHVVLPPQKSPSSSWKKLLADDKFALYERPLR